MLCIVKIKLNCVFCLYFCVLYIVSARKEYATVPYEQPKRITQHVPKVIDKNCLLKPDHGPCRGNIKMYFFDPMEMKCDDFVWGGCQGNGNRFHDATECHTTCLSQSGHKLPRPKYCDLTFDYGYCFGADERYYFDRLWKVCKKGLYSGCGGNKNNFYSLENCENICRFNKGRLPSARANNKDGLKKVLIVNPSNATPKRGLSQRRGGIGSISGNMDRTNETVQLGRPSESDRADKFDKPSGQVEPNKPGESSGQGGTGLAK